jgi:hypothetical protein
VPKEYVSVRRRTSFNWDEDRDGTQFLARTVFEDYELVDIGLVDENGDPIMARRKMDPIGFIRHKE